MTKASDYGLPLVAHLLCAWYMVLFIYEFIEILQENPDIIKSIGSFIAVFTITILRTIRVTFDALLWIEWSTVICSFFTQCPPYPAIYPFIWSIFGSSIFLLGVTAFIDCIFPEKEKNE